ncbi:unnamed protein product, partial [Pylaiella littoralis]
RRQNVAGERVIPACWSVDRTPARRPPPLGKTNAPTTAEKGWSGNDRSKPWYGSWNRSCSCEDLTLGLIGKDMERVTREFHHQNGDDIP